MAIHFLKTALVKYYYTLELINENPFFGFLAKRKYKLKVGVSSTYNFVKLYMKYRVISLIKCNVLRFKTGQIPCM